MLQEIQGRLSAALYGKGIVPYKPSYLPASEYGKGVPTTAKLTRLYRPAQRFMFMSWGYSFQDEWAPGTFKLPLKWVVTQVLGQ